MICARTLACTALPFPSASTVYETGSKSIRKRGGPMGASDESFSWREAEKDLSGGIDTTVPVSARIWNYWMGGKDYYEVDEQAGRQYADMYPGIMDQARACRLFIARTVSYLVREAGVCQFLDIGTGLPNGNNTHEVAQRIAPECRVVYVDNDPLVMAHAQGLLTGTLPGTVDYIDADLNRPADILRIAREKLDFTRPVAVMLIGILGHIGDPEEDEDDRYARSIVEQIKAALPTGGYLALRDTTNTVPAQNEAIRVYNQTGATPFRLRSVEQIVRFFDGLDVVEPGVVPVQEWRPDTRSAELPRDIPSWGGVAVKR
jgi:SAM-dependent methyltransferase